MPSSDARDRIVDVAARLLQEHGPGAVTTRGVAHGAGVQAPMIYRLFGDKDGLLEAVAEHVMANFVAAKSAVVNAAEAEQVDPLEDLRAGWHSQIEFGLGNPAVFRLLSEPDRVRDSPAARSGKRVLEARVHRIAATGRLRVSEKRAAELIQAAGVGVIQTMLATPLEERDPELPDEMLGAVLQSILTEPVIRDADDTVAATVALRAIAPQLPGLSASEQQLLGDWLDRSIAANGSSAPH